MIIIISNITFEAEYLNNTQVKIKNLDQNQLEFFEDWSTYSSSKNSVNYRKNIIYKDNSEEGTLYNAFPLKLNENEKSIIINFDYRKIEIEKVITNYLNEELYKNDLINELISMIEHPENSNEVFKHTVISVAKEKGYGYK